MNDQDKSVDPGTVIASALNSTRDFALPEADSNGVVEPPENAPKQIVIPGSVTEGDLERVFTSFVEWVGWDDPTCIPASHKKLEKRQEILRPRRDKLAKKLARIQGKLDAVEAELRPPEQKKIEAREYLGAAVLQMGSFGSIEVLTAALKKRFPKVIVRPKARKDAQAETPAPAPKPDVPEAAPKTNGGTKRPLPEEENEAADRAREALAKVTRVQDVLDHEGMTMAEIKKALPEFDTGSIKVALDYLITTGAAASIGKKADKKFRLLSQGS